jgi:hypothetical protein
MPDRFIHKEINLEQQRVGNILIDKVGLDIVQQTLETYDG